jgi:8-oxo-dGTP pyrophosphatase MutT (NUDIX family)
MALAGMMTARPESKQTATLKPKDAASLILIDDSGPEMRVLLGKRRPDLKFMPGQFVFPGGRREETDAAVPVASDLLAGDARLIAEGAGPSGTARRAKALAVAAVREFYEETGFVIGKPHSDCPPWVDFAANRLAPDIGAMRYLARAITPPGRSRRFDTRFFISRRSCVTLEVPPPDAEFSEITWATFAATRELDLPEITRTILTVVDSRLRTDPLLSGLVSIPEFRMRGKNFVCEQRQ